MRSYLATALCLVLAPASLHAQAFGEYGRGVANVPQGVGPRAPAGPSPKSGSGVGGVGEAPSKSLPVLLVVAVKEAGLYPKQDEESEKVAELAAGEALVPMVQSSGANEWYMVRTQKGAIGWVKSTDVREEKAKK